MTGALILTGVVIMCCIAFNKISEKVGLPALLLFILLGMLFGSDGIFKIPFDNYGFAEKICSIAMIVIIFYGGCGTKWNQAKKVAVKSILLSSAGVILTAGLVGVFCHFVLRFSWQEGLLIGAVISSTDAASVFSVLRSKKLNLKFKTASILELESGSNDPWAYMLTIIILSVMHGNTTPGSFVKILFAQIFFGLLFGVIISAVGVLCLKHIQFESDGFDAIFVCGVAILSYSLPTICGGNGYLSAYIVGIVIGNTKVKNKKSLIHFFDGVTGFAQILVFFLLGLLATPSQIPQIVIPALAIVLFLTFFARPLSVFFIMKPFGSSLKQISLIAWAGLRGATSIVFAIMVTVDSAYTKNDIFHIVFLIVLISIGFQGTLLPLIAGKLDMIDSNENVMKTFNDYSDETEVQFIRISVNKDGDWSGKEIKDITLPHGILIVMILRNNSKITPDGKTVLNTGDILVLCAPGFYDDTAFILNEIILDDQNAWCGKTLAEISTSDDQLIVMIKRNGKTLIPNGQLRLQENDSLVMTSAKK